MKEPELPKVDILVPAKTLVERKKATGMDDQEFFFEERFERMNERRETFFLDGGDMFFEGGWKKMKG